jgi:epoxyqueuosine reductase
MASTKNENLREQILFQIKEYGATLVGIARVEGLKNSPTYRKYELTPYYENFEGLPDWPEDAKSILIFALIHERSEPELDWWDPKPGGTPGNRLLMQMQKKFRAWLKENLGISSHSLPYKIEKGGIFLKDSAALAGIGIIGKNNLLLTPGYGASVRLRAMFLDVALEPIGPLNFDPCSGCDMPCFRACPQNAFRSGSYKREYCQIQMKKDEDNISSSPDDPETMHVRYCRACELYCPVAS